MKTALLGALIGAGVVAAVIAGFDAGNEVFAQRLQPYPAGGAGGELIVVPLAAQDRNHLLAVIDPHQQAMGVYQVDPANGRIALWSVRNLRWDLQMSEFNTGNPPPREIRSLLEQR